MNPALDKLYSELLHQADEEPAEEITDAEKAKRFLAEKQITIEKLKEVRAHKKHRTTAGEAVAPFISTVAPFVMIPRPCIVFCTWTKRRCHVLRSIFLGRKVTRVFVRHLGQIISSRICHAAVIARYPYAGLSGVGVRHRYERMQSCPIGVLYSTRFTSSVSAV